MTNLVPDSLSLQAGGQVSLSDAFFCSGKFDFFATEIFSSFIVIDFHIFIGPLLRGNNQKFS